MLIELYHYLVLSTVTQLSVLTSQQCWVYCRICMYDCLTGISSGRKISDYVCNVTRVP